MPASSAKTLIAAAVAHLALTAALPALAQIPAAPAIATGASVVRMDPALDRVIAPSVRIEKVATGFGFAEGPMWREGRLWFSDLTGNKVYAVSPDGKTEMLIDKAGGLDVMTGFKGPNAMVVGKDGKVILAQHGARRLVTLDDKLQATPYVTALDGKRLNSPNDAVYAPDGALWFTDPPFGLDNQDASPLKEAPFNGVYRYADGKLTAQITDLAKPNGIGFSPDGKTLYVSNSGPEMMVRRYDVAANGSVSNGRVLISYPGSADDVPDGLKIDSLGNIWTTGPGGIRIIAPDGKVLGQIKLPEVAANLAWGDDGSTAYITASTSIYRLRMLVPGQRPLYGR